MDVSIVIPTKNGGALFDEVLTMIDKQETEYEYEVICVDSGSTDDTVDIIKRHHCILKQIDKNKVISEFQEIALLHKEILIEILVESW